jgi:protein arginine N-methyltransferase 1
LLALPKLGSDGVISLYESMLDTVLYARDRYLVRPWKAMQGSNTKSGKAPGGLIFPDTASIHMAAIEDAEYKEIKIGFWDDVYGFDFSCIKEIALREPLVDTVDMKAIVTKPYEIKVLDLKTVKKEDLAFTAHFQLEATRTDCECCGRLFPSC